MRAKKRDIVELFGYRPDDTSERSKSASYFGICPFISSQCTKTNHDRTIVYGVCSVSNGISKQPGTEIIVCPNRMYANNYKILQDVVSYVWPDEDFEFIIGGKLDQLKRQARNTQNRRSHLDTILAQKYKSNPMEA